MKIRKRHILFSGLLIVLCAIYIEMHLKNISYEKMLDEVYLFQKSDSELNKYILLTRFRVVDNYDEIIRNKNEILLISDNFREKFKGEKEYELVLKLTDAVVEKSYLLDLYQRDNTVLLDTYDKVIEKFEILLEDEQYNNNIQFQDLMKYVMLYMDAGGTKIYDTLDAQVKTMSQIKEFKDEHANLLSEIQTLLKLRLEVKKIYQKIYLVPTTDYLSKLYNAYLIKLNEFLMWYMILRWSMYIFAIGFVGSLGFAMMRLQKTVRLLYKEVRDKKEAQHNLALINRELERRVEARTEQLEKNNLDLQNALKSLKDAQTQIIAQEKMASVGLLAAGISHEIKNPLNFINNFSEVSVELADDLEKLINTYKSSMTADDKSSLSLLINDIKINSQKVLEHGKRADNIVKNMLKHSSNKEEEIETISVNGVLDEYLNLAYHGKRASDKSFNVQFIKEFDDNLPLIEAFPQSLGRVFLNLIENAFYAVNERKKVEGAGFLPVIISRTFFDLKNETVQIEIEDNGSGIAPYDCNKIFQPFFTTKASGKGTGLGLSMSYDIIVNQHLGKIWVESVLGEKTIFYILLPISIKKSLNAEEVNQVLT